MTRVSRILAVAVLTALPLTGTAPAQATSVPCGGAYPAVGVFAMQCPFVYAGGTITAAVSITGPAGHKYVTIGVYPGGRYCQRDVPNTTSTSCTFTFTPSVAVGTVMTCSSAAVGRPVGVVTYSCR